MKLLLAGDVMTGRGIDQVLAHPNPPRLFEPWVRDAREYVRLAEAAGGAIAAPLAPAAVWGDALAEIAALAPDLRIANLETAVTRADTHWPHKGIHYRMHPDNVAVLRAGGWDAFSLANNHVLDWGYAGLDETLATLSAAGLRRAGAGHDAGEASRPAVLPLPGGRRLLLFAVAASSSGVPHDWAAAPDRAGVALLEEVSPASAAELARRIGRERRAGDLVVLSIHWGGNWGFAIPDEHRAFAHELVERGAVDVVHGHSSHHPLPIEVHRGRAILYGCGDLLNDYEGIGAQGSLRSDLGCLYALTLAGEGTLQALEIAPLRIRGFRLERADAAARGWLQRALGEEGAAFGTWLEETSGGRYAVHWI